MSGLPAATAVAERGLRFDGDGWERTPTGLLFPPAQPPKGKRSGLPIGIDLFSGCGGFSLGVHQSGFHVVAACDNDVETALTYLHNLGSYPLDLRFVEDADRDRFEKALRRSYGMAKDDEYPERVDFISGSGWLSNQPPPRYGCDLYWLGDVRKLTGADFLEPLGLKPGEVDVVFGGPPCQGFSVSGKRSVMDPRNSLVFEFTRLVAEIQPKALIFENVPGIQSMVTEAGLPVIGALALDLEDRGYGTRKALERALLASSGCGAALKGKRESDSDDDLQTEEQLVLDEVPA